MNKQLKDKAITIKGKEYVQVADRVTFFNENYENGSIHTALLSDPTSKTIVFRATITPDHDKPERIFTGHAQETVGDGMINKSAALENAETSAIGRAMASFGIGVIDSIASVDEINKAENARSTATPDTPSDKQLEYLERIAETQYEDKDGRKGTTLDVMANELINRSVKTRKDARDLFDALKSEGIIEEQR